jgi:acetyltransferase-like isoleucine patch superfamily enzyme
LEIPPNVIMGENTVVQGGRSFSRFLSTAERALVLGDHCTMQNVHFALGPRGRVKIGDFCFFSNAVLLVEEYLEVGSYVMLGWNVTIADTDFHPLDPALRVADAVALSPLSGGRERPELRCGAVTIEDDVWVGPNATILKGVRIGAGAFIEPGSLVTRDVRPGTRVMGNPARVVGERA